MDHPTYRISSAVIVGVAEAQKIGAVAIGRNEGDRLKRCLTKLVEHCDTVVYVDSDSTDGSLEFAKELGVEVVGLDCSYPFSAARARNAGWRRLIELRPDISYVQFVDGDCELMKDWLPIAESALEKKQRLAVVCGRRRERYAEATIYNRMMDFEWNTPIGSAESCGGDALVRSAALISSGGFDESVVAGEEPELCQRLRKSGWMIERIDAEMTLHDADMSRISQWWRRQRRSGYGAMDVTRRFGVSAFQHELRSARVWTLGVFAVALFIAFVIGVYAGPKWCLLGLGAAGLIYLFQIIRLAFRGMKADLSLVQAVQYGSILMLGKFACLFGQLQWWLDQRRGRFARQIDYKSASLTKTASSR